MGRNEAPHCGCSGGFCESFDLFLACVLVSMVLLRRPGLGRYRQPGWAWGFSKGDETMMRLEGMRERFGYKELSVATKGFCKEFKLGQGGFLSVYRGVLPSSGFAVAVKKIESNSTQGGKEFKAEVSIISQLRHRNLIQLLGWCKDAKKQKYLLVYELMPNGSLDKVLFELGAATESEQTAAGLSCPQRFNIVTGTAAALDYLHQGWTQQVIHRDIKASNIMLDQEWNAKPGDFGLARLVDHQKEAAKTAMAGTYGYIAPEIPSTGRFTEKSDVYAFGAVVLEVVSGQRASAADLDEDEMVLVDWIWHCLGEGDLLSMVDKRLEDYDINWVEVMLKVGLLCSHPDPSARPSMRHVVQILAGDVPVPSVPAIKPAPMPGLLFLNSPTVSIDGTVSKLSGVSGPKSPGSNLKSTSGSMSQTVVSENASQNVSIRALKEPVLGSRSKPWSSFLSRSGSASSTVSKNTSAHSTRGSTLTSLGLFPLIEP